MWCLVGHSLGGGIAQIVAANLYEDHFESHVASTGSNSPGTLFSSGKFGFSTESLQKTSISVLAERDFVSLIDEHGGLIQKIECDSNQIFDCHLTEIPICEMYNNCPDVFVSKPNILDCYCFDQSKDFKFGNCMNATEINL